MSDINMDLTLTIHLEPSDLQVLGHMVCAKEQIAARLTAMDPDTIELTFRPPTEAEVRAFVHRAIAREMGAEADRQQARMAAWQRQEAKREKRRELLREELG